MWRILFLLMAGLVADTNSTHALASEPPRIPQAITGSELRRYGDMLGLSDDQRLAVEREYERYLDEFEPLRAEMIEVAVSHPRHFRSEEELTKRLGEFVARTQSVDETLFAQIDPLLIDLQRQTLPRVRALRERTQLCNLEALGRFIGDGIPELRELLDALDPPADVIAPLTPALEEYEGRLTSGIRGLFEAVTSLCGSGAPQAADQLIEGVRSLRAMNRKLFNDLAPSLPEDLRRKWREEFFLHAYGDISEMAHLWIVPQLEAALASTLTDAERQAVEDLQRQAIRVQDDALEKLAELFDREAIRRAPPGGAVGTPEYLDTINATRRDMEKQDRDFQKALQSLLGKERVAQLKPANVELRRAQAGWRAACGVVAFTGRVQKEPTSPGIPAWGTDPLLPNPITAHDLDDLIAALGLDGERRTTVGELFHVYAERLAKELAPLREESFRYSVHAHVPMREGQDPQERARAGEKLRSRMRTSIEVADAELMESIRAILDAQPDDPTWQRLQRLRARGLVTLNLVMRSDADPNRSAEIDIMRLVLRQHLDGDSWKLIEDTATSYEARLHNLLTERFDAFVKYSFGEVARRDGWKDETADPHRDWSNEVEDLHRRHQAISAFNREMIARFAQTLPANAAAALMDEYNRAAFPLAYSDAANMEPALARAATLQDASAAQRGRVQELRADFAPAYQEVRQRIADLCATVSPDLPMIGKTMTAARAEEEARFTEELARLRDQQAEVNRRALRGLRTTFAAAQLRRLALPEVN